MDILREKLGAINDQEVRERVAALPPRRRLNLFRSVARKQLKADSKAAARGAPATSGYCCPKCHTWHPTPEARKACRASHRAPEGEAIP